MANVSGLTTTYNMPNFVGPLFNLTPADTPFLSMIGGLTGGREANATVFTWQTEDNAAAAQPQIVQGADPTYEERDRAEVSNVVQIFQYGVKIGYTQRAATGQLASTATPVLGDQPVQDELTHQLMLKTQRAARDVEYSFLRGTYTNPADNATGRRTRGIITAVTTNAVAASSAAFAPSHLQELLRGMVDNGAPMTNPVIFANSFQRQALGAAYAYAPESRNVGGHNITTIETEFASLGIVYDRHMPTDTILVADLAYCAPRFLPIDGKGHFFAEPLAQTGAAWNWQLYGEIGLEYGPEQWHGKITGLATS